MFSSVWRPRGLFRTSLTRWNFEIKFYQIFQSFPPHMWCAGSESCCALRSTSECLISWTLSISQDFNKPWVSIVFGSIRMTNCTSRCENSSNKTRQFEPVPNCLISGWSSNSIPRLWAASRKRFTNCLKYYFAKYAKFIIVTWLPPNVPDDKEQPSCWLVSHYSSVCPQIDASTQLWQHRCWWDCRHGTQCAVVRAHWCQP